MNRERRVIAARDADTDSPERLWTTDDYTDEDDWLGGETASRLTTVSFVMSALRRRRRLWCVTAAVGLLLGIGAFALIPPLNHASTTIIVTESPNEDPLSAMQTDVALAQSRTVASRAVQALKLNESVDTFLASYTALGLTDRVLQVTVAAKSGSEAVRRANAVATAFLTFRTSELQTQQALVNASLNQQISADQERVNAADNLITAAQAEPRSPARQAKIADLTEQKTKAETTLVTMQQTARGSESQAAVTTATMVKGTRVIDAATLAKLSAKRLIAFYAGTGLIAGLVIGMGVVVVSALLSSRLRRRDDIAYALGAPVRLSVTSLEGGRKLLPKRRGQAALAERDLRLFAKHLHEAALMPDPRRPNARGAAALAVLAVDNAREAAQPLVSLALSCAQEGDRVLLADLVDGSPAAALLGAAEPGIRMVNVDGAHLAVVIPAPDDVLPAGPLPGGSPRQADNESLVTAYKSADLLLTLVAPDPTVGSGNLSTWATGAVAVVTAGRSTSERIHAVGEMVRLSGVPLLSAVLIGADSSDESVGLPPPQAAPAATSPDLGIIRS
jgi:capsular polysaccharide biosynthesis protein